MNGLAAFSAGLLSVIAAGFLAGAALFVLRVRSGGVAGPPAQPLPKAIVLLPLRGTDPHLEQCLGSLFTQDYPDYEVSIVIDSASDPSGSIVSRLVDQHPGVKVKVDLLRRRLPTCSMKCSALLQMTEKLDEDTEIVVLLDGDVVPHATWLRELAGALGEEGAGVTFGIPWYQPHEGRWGSVVRKVWWIPGAVCMALFGWVWGGSAAIRAQVLIESGLRDRWRRALSSDAPMLAAVRSLGLKTKWVPSLIMANTEECELRPFHAQVLRSLTTSRLYLPRWTLTDVTVLGLMASLAVSAAVFTASLLRQDALAATVSGGALAAYLMILTALLLLVESKACSVIRGNGVGVPPMTLATVGKCILAIPVAHLFYFAGIIEAHFVRRVWWRGVKYAVRGSWDIRLLDVKSAAGAVRRKGRGTPVSPETAVKPSNGMSD